MFKLDEILFALKTFAGALAALFVAYWLQLDNPYWAMATAFIVAHPYAGAMRSKSVYRLFGTLIGASAAVSLVPNLVNSPVLLSLALALWIGLCLYISLLDRSPRAYAFMLAGYTAGIIGFPSVTTPGTIFETAITRTEEICIGIACTTLFGSLIFPRGLGPVLARRIADWTKPAMEWTISALAGEGESPSAREARRQLAFEATDAAMMISQLSYDISRLQTAVRYVARLRIYVISLMPVLSSIGGRVAQLKQLGAITPELQDVLDSATAWIRAGDPENADVLLEKIEALEDGAHDWAGLLRASLALRLEELVRIVRHARAIRRHVMDGEKAPANPVLDAEYIAVTVQDRDHKLALLSGFAAALATLLVCAVWINTRWSAGAGAAVIVAIACSFFATQDDPAPAIARMLHLSVIIIFFVGIYTFIVLPGVVSFTELCLVLLPVGLVIGVLIARPATFGTGMILGAFGPTQLALGNGYQGDFASFANNSLAMLFGFGSALLITRIVRSVGAEWSAERLMRANWRNVASAAEAHGMHDRGLLTGIMVDRLGLMMSRMASVATGADRVAADSLRDLRVGLDMVSLHREQWRLPVPGRQACDAIFKGVALHYRGDPREAASASLLEAIDIAIRTLLDAPFAHRAALTTLSGLRSLLFPAAPPPAIEAWISPSPARQVA
jgi:uncharacterized membrane protein YccC